jgi:hypothetical protein
VAVVARFPDSQRHTLPQALLHTIVTNIMDNYYCILTQEHVANIKQHVIPQYLSPSQHHFNSQLRYGLLAVSSLRLLTQRSYLQASHTHFLNACHPPRCILSTVCPSCYTQINVSASTLVRESSSARNIRHIYFNQKRISTFNLSLVFMSMCAHRVTTYPWSNTISRNDSGHQFQSAKSYTHHKSH